MAKKIVWPNGDCALCGAQPFRPPWFRCECGALTMRDVAAGNTQLVIR